MSTAAALQLPVHPALAALAQGGQPPESTIRLGGYVGQASQSGCVRLYSSLEDLSHYLEFEESIVVQTAEAAEYEYPGQGHWIWVKQGGPVRWIREYQTATGLRDQIASNLAQTGGLTS